MTFFLNARRTDLVFYFLRGLEGVNSGLGKNGPRIVMGMHLDLSLAETCADLSTLCS